MLSILSFVWGRRCSLQIKCTPCALSNVPGVMILAAGRFWQREIDFFRKVKNACIFLKLVDLYYPFHLSRSLCLYSMFVTKDIVEKKLSLYI